MLTELKLKVNFTEFLVEVFFYDSFQLSDLITKNSIFNNLIFETLLSETYLSLACCDQYLSL